MADQELRDGDGRLIGRIKTLNGGKQEIRNDRGTLLGTYDPKVNETRNDRGQSIGKGNLLTMLLR